MNKILLYAYFEKNEKFSNLPEYITCTLEKFRPLTKKTILISNVPILNSDSYNDIFDDLVVYTDAKNNFTLWREGIKKVNTLDVYDALILMDNSCLGPFFDIEQFINNLYSKNFDILGLTSERKVKINNKVNYIPEDYFMLLKKTAITSNEFKNFWNKKKELNTKKAKSTFFKNLLKKFSSATYLESTYKSIDILYSYKIPFLQIKKFFDFDKSYAVLKVIQYSNHYDKNIFDSYIFKNFPPNISILLSDKKLLNLNTDCNNNASKILKNNNSLVAIHIHAFYIDVLEKYFKILKTLNLNSLLIKIDIFITTNSEDKKNEIKLLISKYNLDLFLKEIIVLPNKGRDVLPWLLISDKLNNYDIVGHFHTKKSNHQKDFVSNLWSHELLNSLFSPMLNIIKTFIENKNIGIVISDIPSCFLKFSSYWVANKKNCINLLKKMELKKNIDLRQVKIPIMPYGNMFWYKPLALKPLFDLNLNSSNFPEEPLPLDGTIAHAIERLPVYIAWCEGYDFRVSTTPEMIDNRFLVKIRKKYNIANLIEHICWRIGKYIILPRSIKTTIKNVIKFLLKDHF